MEDKILIDKDTLKAISVDTRLNILKLLNKKKYTQTEIAQILNKSNSSIKEHIDILIASGLIKKENTSRKWKYFSLTLKGKRILGPNEFKVIFSFFISTICAFGLGIYYFFRLNSLFNTDNQIITNEYNQDAVMAVRSMSEEMTFASAPQTINSSSFPIEIIILSILIIILVFISGFLVGILFKKRKFFNKKKLNTTNKL